VSVLQSLLGGVANRTRVSIGRDFVTTAEYARKWRSENRQKDRELQRNWRESNPKKVRRKHWKWNARLKYEVLAVYGGPICVCCGETMQEFLTLDHINGGGNQQKREDIGGGAHFYPWLRRNNYPNIALQVLCMNCNWASGQKNHRCPHEVR